MPVFDNEYSRVLITAKVINDTMGSVIIKNNEKIKAYFWRQLGVHFRTKKSWKSL